jgi:hypothetical protein
LSGIEANPDVPDDLAAQAQIELAGISDDQLSDSLADAGVEAETADAIVEDNEQSRLDGLRVSLSILALVALVALFFSSRIPIRQPGSEP